MNSFISNTHLIQPIPRLSGFNLIETAIVLGVVGFVIGGIWVAASAVNRTNNINTFISRIAHITDDVQSNFRVTAISEFAMKPYLIAKGLYSSSEDAPSVGNFYARELGQNAIISYSFYPANSTNQGQAGLRIRAQNMDTSLCRPILSKLTFYMNPIVIMGITLTVQQVFDLAVAECEGGNGIDISLDKVVR